MITTWDFVKRYTKYIGSYEQDISCNAPSKGFLMRLFAGKQIKINGDIVTNPKAEYKEEDLHGLRVKDRTLYYHVTED